MKNIFITCCFLFLGTAAFAQYERGIKKLNLWYNYAMPMGDIKTNYFGDNSPRAASVEMLWHLNSQLQLGIGSGIANFYEKTPRQTYKLADGSDISAVMTNTLQSIPVLATAVYSPMNKAGAIPVFSPFVQLGAGIAMNNFNRYLGEFTNESFNKVQFAAKAGVGGRVAFGRYKQHGVLAGVHYNYSGLSLTDANSLTYLTGGIGLSFAIAD